MTQKLQLALMDSQGPRGPKRSNLSHLPGGSICVWTRMLLFGVYLYINTRRRLRAVELVLTWEKQTPNS